MTFIIPTPPCPSIPVVGIPQRFPVRRIYCVGRNYAEHAQEMGHSGREAPFFFMKPADAIWPVDPRADTDEPPLWPYPSLTHNLHHEVELVVALGRGGRAIPVQTASEHIWGYAVGLDMTRRDLQNALKQQGRPWSIAKGFDASAPIGWLTPAPQAGDIGCAPISLHVNGNVRQQGHIGQMIWSVAEVIAELSRAWTLQPGDLIFSGTPAGVGAVAPGDVLQARIGGLAPLCLRIGPEAGEGSGP